ncbi:RNA polymerase sigma factor [Steroidobacter flavus]|uniref:RNA polymerase sigma factor n=1 Tax=Steroidobacter flavus TaxID=1842136 RepID=A0ABV8T5Q6_9GAMM
MASIEEDENDRHVDLAPGLLFTAYMREKAALRQLLRTRTRDTSVADDLVQDLWFRVRKVAGSKPVRNPGAFLRTIARNLATDWMRRENMIASMAGAPEQADDVPCGRPSAFDERVSEEAVAFLMRVIEEIPPRRRQAFLLHRFEGLTIAETSQRMGTSAETVERQVAQALSYCQARLLECGWTL